MLETKERPTFLALPQPLNLPSSLLQHPLLILLRLPNTNIPHPILLRRHLHLLQLPNLSLLRLRRRNVLRTRHHLNLPPNPPKIQILQINNRSLLRLPRRRRILIRDLLRGIEVRRVTRLLAGKVDRQRSGPFLLRGLLDRHRDAGVVVFESREAVSPEMSRALVAVVDFLGVG